MAENYRSQEVQSAAAGAPIVIHCSDPRYQPHFQEFLGKGLKLDYYALVAVPGGPQLLALDDQAGWGWMKFMVELTRTRRVVLIQHDDCRWYLQSLMGRDAERVRQKMNEDAQRVRATLKDRYGVEGVEIYYAKLTGKSAVFETLT